MAIELLLPTVTRTGAARATAARREPPPEAVLALVDNTKTRARDLLVAIGDEMVGLGAAASYFVVTKPTASHALSASASSEMLRRAHLVVSGVGDCGACTSCSVHDAVHCAEQGVPAAVVVTDPFVGLAEMSATRAGSAGIGIVEVEHPIWARDAAGVLELAAEAAPRLVEALGLRAATPTGGPSA